VLAGRFATEPDAAASESLRALLHEELEKGARADVLDRGFYLRLLVSASVFLVFYLFLSVVIRDPVPLVDEFLVGGLGSAACWLALERRSLFLSRFLARLAALRTSLDSALFQSSRVCRALEESLQDAEPWIPEIPEYLVLLPEFDATEEERRELTAVSSASGVPAAHGCRRGNPEIAPPRQRDPIFSSERWLERNAWIFQCSFLRED
jgi:hypothetical protein